jgi:flagellar biosynthetic protein FliQ
LTTESLTAIGRDLLVTAAWLSLPTIVVSLVVGLLVSIFQAVTSLQEQTLSFAPRMISVTITLLLMLPWNLQVAMAFTQRMFQHILEAAQ